MAHVYRYATEIFKWRMVGCALEIKFSGETSMAHPPMRQRSLFSCATDRVFPTSSWCATHVITCATHVPRLQVLGVLLLQLRKLIHQVCIFVHKACMSVLFLRISWAVFSYSTKNMERCQLRNLSVEIKKQRDVGWEKKAIFVSPSSFLQASSKLAI